VTGKVLKYGLEKSPLKAAKWPNVFSRFNHGQLKTFSKFIVFSINKLIFLNLLKVPNK
jgi:hypothetical protein